MEEELIAAFEVFQIELESGSTLLDRREWSSTEYS